MGCVCVFICRKWSYAIVGNMVMRKTRINWLDEKHLLMNFYSKVLQLSKLPRCRKRQILPNQNISKVEKMVNSAILAEERKCQKNILEGGGTRIYWDLIQWTFIWPNIGVPANNWFDWTTWPAPAGNYFELYIWFESFASVLLLWGNSAIFNLHYW